MIDYVLKKEKYGFEWVNLINPSLRELAQVSVDYDLPSIYVHDCLEPENLPKFEPIGNDVLFIIMRAYDGNATEESDTIRKITNKLVVFLGKNFLVTIHRSDHEYLRIIRNRWRVQAPNQEDWGLMVVVDMIKAVINSYEEPVSLAGDTLDHLEEGIFTDKAPSSLIEQMYLIRRKASIYRKMLFLTNEVFDNLLNYKQAKNQPFLQNISDKSNEIQYYTEQLHSNANDLLNIHLSLASHRTNEVMKVLTIASVFFLPLTFMAGVYGMNFVFMPELQSEYAYFSFWLLTGIIVLAIYLKFKEKGWLKDVF